MGNFDFIENATNSHFDFEQHLVSDLFAKITFAGFTLLEILICTFGCRFPTINWRQKIEFFSYDWDLGNSK